MYTFLNSDINKVNLFVFEFAEKVSKDEFEKFNFDFDNLLKNNNSFYAIFNLLGIKDFDLNFFYKKMDYIYKNKIRVKQLLTASSIVIKEAYGKVIKFGLKIKKPISPNIVCSDLEEGKEFIQNFQTNLDKIKISVNQKE